MQAINLHDNGKHLDFAPFSLTRPIGALRIGILTNEERFRSFSNEIQVGFTTEAYLLGKFPKEEGIAVNACVIPDRHLMEVILALKEDQALYQHNLWIAGDHEASERMEFEGEIPAVLENRWDLYQQNAAALKSDFELLTAGRTSHQLSSTNTILGDDQLIFLEEGAVVEGCTLNTSNGPIYVGRNAEIMEGSLVRGPLAMNAHSALKLGTKVYGATTLGPHCKVGGEVNNVIFQGYSNKGHDGFLGNSVIGEWCNLGADTNCSNLKNNYGTVKTYSFRTNSVEQTNVQFMGLMMGDHSKCGINTMFNTATVVGVSANVFGAGFPDKYVPSFSWGTDGTSYNFEKAVESANNMMERRGLQLSTDEIAILKHVAESE